MRVRNGRMRRRWGRGFNGTEGGRAGWGCAEGPVVLGYERCIVAEVCECRMWRDAMQWGIA